MTGSETQSAVTKSNWFAHNLPSMAVLVLANLVPLYGVLALGWELFPIMLLFWSENVIIGAFNILKMLCANPREPAAWVMKIFMIPFFAFHYGMFTFIHGIFVLALFGGKMGPGGGFPGPHRFVEVLSEQHVWYAVLALVASHAFSFVWYYIRLGEFRTVLLPALMSAPYSRVVVLHLTILLGGFAMMALKAPAAALAVLVIVKITVDVRAHLREHPPKLGATTTSPGTGAAAGED